MKMICKLERSSLEAPHGQLLNIRMLEILQSINNNLSIREDKKTRAEAVAPSVELVEMKRKMAELEYKLNGKDARINEMESKMNEKDAKFIELGSKMNEKVLDFTNSLVFTTDKSKAS